MKSMLKSTLLFTMLFLSSGLIGQLAIRGGVNYANVSISGDGIETETDSKSGLQGGLMYTIGLGDKLAFRPGAILSIKGYKLNDQNIDWTYLEFPASFLLYFASSRDGLYIELGPYVGTGIESDLGDFGDDLKRLDFGANIGVGLELGSVGVGINYGYGIGNIADGEFSTDGDVSNKNFGLFGYIQF